MSCNGCRVLRKGCSESCVLRPCLQWIENDEAQGHATVFVAKFFGRAGLMSFISAVPESQRPASFQSLLFEACGRTVNPVNGAVGLLGTGNWHVCQAAVETVLRSGTLRPISEFMVPTPASTNSRSKISAKLEAEEEFENFMPANLDLSLSPSCASKRVQVQSHSKRQETPVNSEDSGLTICFDSGLRYQQRYGGGAEKQLLKLFV